MKENVLKIASQDMVQVVKNAKLKEKMMNVCLVIKDIIQMKIFLKNTAGK